MTKSSKTALCLTGGGVTGGLYQVGALAALEDVIDGLGFDFHIGTSSGASLAAGLAGGIGVQRLYRAFLDPADTYFPIERGHILSIDFDEWRRTLGCGISVLRHGLASLVARTPAPSPSDVWEQLDRFYDALPAGFFTLDRYERFLSDFFFRRGISNSFRSIHSSLLITANDLDTGERVLFGSSAFEHVPISLACAASMALPLFFSPVRIDGRYYIDGGVGCITDIEVAREQGAKLVVLLNPNVPVRVQEARDGVPTGHGSADSVRDKGLIWIYNQALRASYRSRLHESIERAKLDGDVELLVIEPDATDAVRFLNNAASFSARRAILEWSYRTTRERVRRWIVDQRVDLSRFGWRLRASDISHAVASADGLN